MSESKILANISKIIECGGKISMENNGHPSDGSCLTVKVHFPGCETFGTDVSLKDFNDATFTQLLFGTVWRAYELGEFSEGSPTLNLEQPAPSGEGS